MVDAYAFGMMLHELMCHEPPWNGVQSSEVYALVASGKRPEVPRNVDPEAAPEGWFKLLRACSEQNAQDRPEFDTMLPMLTAMIVTPNQSTCVVNMQSAEPIQQADGQKQGGSFLNQSFSIFEIQSESLGLYHRLVD